MDNISIYSGQNYRGASFSSVQHFIDGVFNKSKTMSDFDKQYYLREAAAYLMKEALKTQAPGTISFGKKCLLDYFKMSATEANQLEKNVLNQLIVEKAVSEFVSTFCIVDPSVDQFLDDIHHKFVKFASQQKFKVSISALNLVEEMAKIIPIFLKEGMAINNCRDRKKDYIVSGLVLVDDIQDRWDQSISPKYEFITDEARALHDKIMQMYEKHLMLETSGNSLLLNAPNEK